MKICDFLNSGVVVLKLLETRCVNLYTDFTFEKDVIILINAHKQNADTVYITFFNLSTNSVHRIFIDKSFPCVLAEGEEKNEASKTFNVFAARNLGSILPSLYLTIGSDPEIFAETKEGQLIPAFDFLPSKSNPALSPRMSHVTNNPNKLYWDGFQAEFDTTSFGCLGWHSDSVQNGLKGIYTNLTKHNPTAILSHKPTVAIAPDLLASAKDEHVQFGCMPSKNVYGLKGIQDDGRNVGFRSAGGHIHFGFPVESQDAVCIERMVKALDKILGVACVSLFAGFDDPRRRSMYGLAGEYRTPAHGLEYRTLSNGWLMHPLLMNAVFDLGRAALRFGFLNLSDLWECSDEDAIRIINTCNVEDARKLLLKNETMFRQLLKGGYGASNIEDLRVQGAFRLFLEGVSEHIQNPTDIIGNWKLNGHWQTHSGGPSNNMLSASNMIIVYKKKVA